MADLVAIVLKVKMHVCPQEHFVHGRQYVFFQLANEATDWQVVCVERKKEEEEMMRGNDEGSSIVGPDRFLANTQAS